MAPVLHGGRDVTRKVHPGDADTTLVPLQTMRRRGRRAVDGRDVLRDRGARAPMERASGVLVVQPPSGIAHIHLTMIARGINDGLVTMTVRADIGADTDRARALLIRRLAQKPCLRV